jgi:hypothetical protein
MAYTEQASWLIGPTAAADATGLTGVYRYATLTTNQSVALPAAWVTARTDLGRIGSGPFIRVYSGTTYTQVAFTAAAAVLVIDQASVFGTGHVSAGGTVPTDSYVDFMIPRGCGFITWISKATGGFVEFYLNEGGR